MNLYLHKYVIQFDKEKLMGSTNTHFFVILINYSLLCRLNED